MPNGRLNGLLRHVVFLGEREEKPAATCAGADPALSQIEAKGCKIPLDRRFAVSLRLPGSCNDGASTWPLRSTTR
jgi:hypothetical protein